MTWVSELPRGWVTAEQRLVLFALAADSWDGLDSAPGWDALAAWTGMHASSVRKIVADLERATVKRPGLLRREDNKGGRRAVIVLLDPINLPVTPAGSEDVEIVEPASEPAGRPAGQPAGQPASELAGQPAGVTGTSASSASAAARLSDSPSPREDDGWGRRPETIDELIEVHELSNESVIAELRARHGEGMPVDMLGAVLFVRDEKGKVRSHTTVQLARLKECQDMTPRQVWAFVSMRNRYGSTTPVPGWAHEAEPWEESA